MAQGYGWGDAVIDGFKDGRRQEDVKQQREERALGIKVTKEKMADDQRARDLQTSRQQDLIAAQQPPQSADGSPMGEVRPFEAYSTASQRRLAAGDMEGYEQFASKADAHKAKWYTDAIGEAYRKNDMEAGLSLLNEFPDGVKYALERGENGELVGVAAGPDGKVKGRMPFKSEGEFWGFISQRADPASVFQKLRDQRKAELEGKKAEADIAQSNAAAAASNSTATYNTERTAGERVQNDLLRRFGPQKEEAEVGRIKAQASAAQGSAAAGFANAEESRAGAGLKRKQAEGLPTGDEAKNDRTAMQMTQEAERRAAAHNKLHQYSPENHRTAADYEEQVRAEFARNREAAKPGAGFARKPAAAVPGQATPGVPAAKDFSNLWK